MREEKHVDPVVNREETFPRDCYSGLTSIQQPEARGQFSQFYAQASDIASHNWMRVP